MSVLLIEIAAAFHENNFYEHNELEVKTKFYLKNFIQ